MAISLGGVTLPDLIMSGEFVFGDSGVGARFTPSRNGTALIFEQQSGYKFLDLIGDSDAGWISHETLASLLALAEVPNAEYTLSYEGTDYQVHFRNWEQPVIEADAIIPRPNTANSDWYNNVIIKLLVEV